MESVKDILKFCNDSIFYDYKNAGNICDLNQDRKCAINSFYKRIPHNRILVSLSIIDDIILTINNNDIENIIENFHDLRENTLYMLAFEKFIRDERQTDKDEYYPMHFFFKEIELNKW